MHAERLYPAEISPDAYRAIRAVEAAARAHGLPERLIELVKLRASQINGCAFCLDMHSRLLRAAGEPEQRLHVLAGWRDSPLFTAAERAVLGWTEALTLLAETHAPDAAYAPLRDHFSDREIVDQTILIGTINLWNRLAIGMRYVHDVAAA